MNEKVPQTEPKASSQEPAATGPHTFVLTLSCHDEIGIVAAVSDIIARNRCNILESAQYGDPETQQFFMRIAFEAPKGLGKAELVEAFEPAFTRYRMHWRLFDTSKPMRVMIMVSKFDHCLADLLYRRRTGTLPMEIAAIVSNHEDAWKLADDQAIPFHYLPVTKETKSQQEARIGELIRSERVDLVILARYMQILSDDFSRSLFGRCINIHHSFLPSFKGARPYHQAHKRGVKIIGATAHYVTPDLDEGPIIEQETERVDHAMSADKLVAVGRDIENRVLARAVRYHLEHRILINETRTVVFK
ncbi:MAG: formyltetrahydrofolate deformylase [Magnetovibrionaceae bacterium]